MFHELPVKCVIQYDHQLIIRHWTQQINMRENTSMPIQSHNCFKNIPNPYNYSDKFILYNIRVMS